MESLLVLQFEIGGELDSYDMLIAFEETLYSVVGETAKVDGHDFGSGEMNIFIFAEDPVATFDLIQKSDQSKRPDGQIKAAYRALDSDDYVCLWPPGLTNFGVI